MQPSVETPSVQAISALERRIDLSLSPSDIEREVSVRLTKLSRTVRLPGFRPGKVPMKMVAASYGMQVHSEVLNDKLNEAFNTAVNESKLRVAGPPRVEPKEGAPAESLAFSATFEVYPEIKIADVASLAIDRAVCPVGDAELDSTLNVMRKQRATYEEVARAAQSGDKVTVDFVGKLDDVAFEGGSATDFSFVLGEGRMLPEFETAVTGLKQGDKKTFPLNFPADYHAKNLAGKQAQFEATLKNVEQPVLPAVDTEFAKALGVPDGNVEKMRSDIKTSLEREVANRLKSRTKESIFNALMGSVQFDLPKALIEADQQRLADMMRSDLLARGVAQAKDAPLPPSAFAPQAEKRVRLGLLLNELVRSENLQAKQDQVRKAIEELAQSYERPAEVIQWYLNNRERIAEIEATVTEDNVVAWVLQRAKVTDKPVSFDELMDRKAA